MNRTMVTGPTGLISGNLNTSKTVDIAAVLGLVSTFGVASFLARTLNSRTYILHGTFNTLLLLYFQGVLAHLKKSLPVVILASLVIQHLVRFWLDGAEREDTNDEDVRLAGRLTSHENESKDDTYSHDEGDFLRPMIFPSRTTHRRLFPTQHDFNYSYLLVGVPVSNTARITPNPMLSTLPYLEPKHITESSQAWFSVNASDYLQRGRAFSNSTLRLKLDQFLETEGVKPDLYPYAYLVTAPRFLGFSFNPVSFWYLHDGDKSLAAMILEVNNTFDERRMYFLQRSQPSSDELTNSEELETRTASKTMRFTQNWVKDFHVSPFNDRGGSYSVTVSDVAATQALDNTIVLQSDDNKPKIIARIYSTEQGIDPASMSLWTRISFLLRWFWVGFMTNPRILKEARILWVKKLQVFYRPEPLRSSIGRNETPEEVIVEKHFRQMLSTLAKRAKVTVEYSPAAGCWRGQSVTLGGTYESEEPTAPPPTTVKLQILTPEFYSELARERGGIVYVFERVCFQNNNNSTQRQSSASNPNLLVWTDDEDAVRKLFPKRPHSRVSDAAICRSSRLSQLEYTVIVLRRQERSLWKALLWIFIRSLGFQYADQEEFTLSEMDEEVKINGIVCGTTNGYLQYLCSALRAIMIDRLAFGFRALFMLEIRVVRFLAVLLVTQLVRIGLRMVLID